MSIVSQVLTKQKAMVMIETCESQDHFNSTMNYIELYHKKFEDFLGYNELKQYHKETQLKSLKPKT